MANTDFFIENNDYFLFYHTKNTHTARLSDTGALQLLKQLRIS